MCEPICCYLLDTTSGWILLDTGTDPVYLKNKDLTERYFFSAGFYPPVVSLEHELDYQLKQLNLSFSDIKRIVLSHLHLDHTGYLKYFPHAQVYIQRQEYAHGFTSARPTSYFLEDYNLPDIKWELRDDDWELVPGLQFLKTRGHTPGHQSAVVELPLTGTYVLPFDVGDLQENFDHEIVPGETVDDAAALASIRRLKAIIAERQAQMILFHDPVAIQRYRLAPDFYE